MMQGASMTFCALTALALMVRLNQLHLGGGVVMAAIWRITHPTTAAPENIANASPLSYRNAFVTDWLRVSIGALALCYVYKTWQRIDGIPANLVDLLRECCLFSAVVSHIVLKQIRGTKE